MAAKKPTELAVKYLPTADLIPYARNARTHNEQQVKQIAASIQEFGFTNPVLIDGKKGIIAGHGRVMAAEILKMDNVPTIELLHLTPAQKRAYVIADNKLALNAGWDMELLKLEIEELHDADFDLKLTGFTDTEINRIVEFDLTGAGMSNTHMQSDERFLVMIACEDENEQKELFDELKEREYQVTLMS